MMEKTFSTEFFSSYVKCKMSYRYPLTGLKVNKKMFKKLHILLIFNNL